MKKLLLLFLLLCIQSSFAEMMCDDAQNVYFAVYVINTYTCESGYYLPANTNHCSVCKYGHSCSGGTYTFNIYIDQGINITEYICEPGYFLPANTDGCQPCPDGFVCGGGTFEFNSDIYQGAQLITIPTTTMNNVCADNFPTDIYAVYEPNVVTLNWDDGFGNTTTNTCTYDGAITLPPIPSRPGYVFSGWNVQRNN